MDYADIKLYTPAEAAEIVGLSGTTIRKYIQAGKIAGRKHGNTYYIEEDDLKAFLATRGQK